MRIVCLSDTHNCTPPLPPGDVLIHAGDLTSRGTYEQTHAAAEWLRTQPHQFKLVIAGNHDFWLEREGPTVLRGLTYLQDSGIEIGGHLFWGSPWVPRFQNWAFLKDRGEAIRQQWRLIPQETSVLITHGPPAGIMDRVSDELHAGCADLLRRVLEVKPLLHVFGHVHESGGVQVQAGITFANVAYVNITPDHRPLPGRKPLVFSLG